MDGSSPQGEEIDECDVSKTIANQRAVQRHLSACTSPTVGTCMPICAMLAKLSWSWAMTNAAKACSAKSKHTNLPGLGPSTCWDPRLDPLITFPRYIHNDTFIYIYIFRNVLVCLLIYMLIHINIHISVHWYVCMYMYVSIYIYNSIVTCVYIYISCV